MVQQSKTLNYLYKVAAPWVSTFVLIGCIAITVGLVYLSTKSATLANEWTVDVGVFEN